MEQEIQEHTVVQLPQQAEQIAEAVVVVALIREEKTQQVQVAQA
jgi:hypothetical protein